MYLLVCDSHWLSLLPSRAGGIKPLWRLRSFKPFFSFCIFFTCFNLISLWWVIEPPCSDGNGWILTNHYCFQSSSLLLFSSVFVGLWVLVFSSVLVGLWEKEWHPTLLHPYSNHMLNFNNFMTGNFNPTDRRWPCQPFGQELMTRKSYPEYQSSKEAKAKLLQLLLGRLFTCMFFNIYALRTISLLYVRPFCIGNEALLDWVVQISSK